MSVKSKIREQINKKKKQIDHHCQIISILLLVILKQ